MVANTRICKYEYKMYTGIKEENKIKYSIHDKMNEN